VIWAVKIDSRENCESHIQEEEGDQSNAHEVHHDVINRQQKSDEAGKEKEEGGMPKEGDHVHNGVHPKSLQSKIEKREYPGPGSAHGRRLHLRLVTLVWGPNISLTSNCRKAVIYNDR
jgi:hypothetical protein